MPTAELSQFRFLGHRVESLRFDRQEGAAVDGEYHLNIRFDSDIVAESSFQSAEGNGDDHESGDLTETLVALRIWLEWEPNPGPFGFEIKVIGRFQRHPEMPASAFLEFSRISGPSVLFSHIRPFVRTLMIEAGEQFRLPLLNIRDSIRKLDQALDE